MDCNICLEPTSFIRNHIRYIKPRHSNDVLLKCNHCFHRKCIKRWFNTALTNLRQPTCPCCRADVKFKEGSYYNDLIILYHVQYTFNSEHDMVYEEEEEEEYYKDVRFIYHDNASLTSGFVRDVLVCISHHANMGLWRETTYKDRATLPTF